MIEVNGNVVNSPATPTEQGVLAGQRVKHYAQVGGSKIKGTALVAGATMKQGTKYTKDFVLGFIRGLRS